MATRERRTRARFAEWRIAVLGILAWILVLPSLALAHAGGAPFIDVPLDHVTAGTSFPVVGADLGPRLLVDLSMSLAGRTADLGTATAGPDGHFETTCNLPADFPDGYGSLTATADDGTIAQAYVLIGARTEGSPPSPGSTTDWWANAPVLVAAVLIVGTLAGLMVLRTQPGVPRGKSKPSRCAGMP